MNYDDAVRFTADYVKKNGYHFVQYTGSEDYEEIPNYITQGYPTMAFEAAKQLESLGVEKPSHLFLQEGVGSMAGGVLGFFAHWYKKNPPDYNSLRALASGVHIRIHKESETMDQSV